MNYYNPWGMPTPGIPNNNNANIDNLYAAYKQMQMQMQNPVSQPSMNVNPAMGQRGTWQQVKEYKDVENCPVPTDGTPTLFFDFDHGVFYSKKFVNGQCCIQDFYFGPTGSNGTAKDESPLLNDLPVQNNNTEPLLTALLEKFNDLEKKVNSMNVKLSNQTKSKSVGD